ncbi:MAG TPA: DUF3857 domain-containing protein [Candidatus Angelobacter sp.]
MRSLSPWCLALGFCLLAALPVLGQQSEEWLPVTARDLEMKDVPGDPGAAAVQLYYADFRDDVRESEFIYKRIKVLGERGKDYANVEIEVPQHYSIGDLQARTVHPDGTILEFRGKPFDKLVVRYRGEQIVAKAFTMPDVTVGSIVEYKYRLTWSTYFHDPMWTVQHELYTVKESFWLRRYTGPLETRHISDQTRLSYVTSNMPAGAVPKDTGPGVELQLQNVPAFRPERYMPPEMNFKAQVQFFYGGREIESPELFWRDLGLDWYAKAEHFIGNHQELKTAAGQIIGAETDPEKKLRKLYARAQQTRNLNYESERSRAEGWQEALKPNENVVDVFTRDYGWRNEIAELFAALARSAGFQADLLRVSSRRDRVFDPKLLSENQLAAEIVRVNLNGADLFLDPGSRFCPFGLIAWTYTSVPALQLDKNGGSFVVVPTATADKSVIRRNADATLSADGELRGEITIEFKGNEGLRRRLDALQTDQTGRRQTMEDDLESWLPPGSVVELKDVQGWDSSEEPLVAHFAFQSSGFATPAGKRLLFPASLFRSKQMEAFTSSERRYPVYFPYTFEEIDKVTLHLPADYSPPAALPSGQDVHLPSSRFITTRSASNGQLFLTRALVVNSIYFQPDKYAALKSFFNKLRAADEEQVVLEQKSR